LNETCVYFHWEILVGTSNGFSWFDSNP
jgi:hypothetical protein